MSLQDLHRPFQAEISDEIRDRAGSRYTLVLCAQCQDAMHLQDALACGATIVDVPAGRLHGVIDRCARCAAADHDTARNRQRVLRRVGATLAGAVLVTGAAIAGLVIVGAMIVLLGRSLAEGERS